MTENVFDFSQLVDLAQATGMECMAQTLGFKNFFAGNILYMTYIIADNVKYTPNKCPDWIHNICEAVIEKVEMVFIRFWYLLEIYVSDEDCFPQFQVSC